MSIGSLGVNGAPWLLENLKEVVIAYRELLG